MNERLAGNQGGSATLPPSSNGAHSEAPHSDSINVAAVALWEALEALLTECDNDILFKKCPPLNQAHDVLAQTERAVREARGHLARQHSHAGG